MTILHSPVVEISGSVPDEVAAGAELTFKAVVRCPSGCDLSGRTVEVTTPTEVVTSAAVLGLVEGTNEIEKIVVNAPDTVGEYQLKVLLPRHDSEGVVHEEALATVSIRTLPHRTSLAVWGLPSPATRGRPFTLVAGVKCAESCELGGQLIEIRDDRASPVAVASLRQTPEPNTTKLYAAAVQLTAPPVEGVSHWTVTFLPAGLRCSHEAASVSFSFRTAGLPDHGLTVRVLEQATGTPVVGAEVRAGFYRTATGSQGVANLDLPKGTYELTVSKANYDSYSQTLAIDADVTCQASLIVATKTDPDDDRVWM